MTIDEIEARILALDTLLDDETLTDAEFDALENEVQRLYADLGRAESCDRLADVKEVSVSQWLISFLLSFGGTSGSRVISAKQYEVFRKVNHGKPFKYNGLRYDFGKCKGNWAQLLITVL